MAEPDAAAEETVRVGLSESEMRDNVIRLAFGGDPRRYEEFCETIRREMPPDTAAVLRGSAVTGMRHGDNAPFDADGPGTAGDGVGVRTRTSGEVDDAHIVGWRRAR